MNPIAHNINVKKLMAVLLEFKCEYVDIMIDDDFTVRIKPSSFDALEEDGEIDINDLTF